MSEEKRVSLGVGGIECESRITASTLSPVSVSASQRQRPWTWAIGGVIVTTYYSYPLFASQIGNGSGRSERGVNTEQTMLERTRKL